MAVVVASSGTILSLCSNLKANDKQPSARVAPFFWAGSNSGLLHSFKEKGENSKEADEIPIPKVIIDQDSHPDATNVEITFGDRFGALLDTVILLNTLHESIYITSFDEYFHQLLS